jgi:hypothetical protein
VYRSGGDGQRANESALSKSVVFANCHCEEAHVLCGCQRVRVSETAENLRDLCVVTLLGCARAHHTLARSG